MTDRVVTVTRQDILDMRRDAVREVGLSLPFLEQKEHEHGTGAVAGWLEDHNFYDLAGVWATWSWLLDGKDRP